MLKTTVHGIGLWLLVFMTATVWFASSAYPMVASSTGAPSGDNRQTASQNKARLSTEFLVGIKDNVLYTENNSYSLQHVRITHRPAQLSELASPNSKQIVELFFLNNVLKEVVIHGK